jgi:poly(A) polymerase
MTRASEKDQSDVARDAGLGIVRALHGAGHVAYFAGGCVRDALLKLTPKDYDVATSATPQQVKAVFKHAHAVGAAFGVMLVPCGAVRVEVATFRTDGHYSDGRRPDTVTFSTPQHDAQRRDFTINGLFYDPLNDRVIDYVDGQADLSRGIVRAIGNPSRRFAEDYLRLLRGVRFAARFGFVIEPDTAHAITYHAPRLADIAAERVTDELRRMLGAPTRVAAVDYLWSLKLIDVIAAQPGNQSIEIPPGPVLSRQLSPDADFPTALLALLTDYQTPGVSIDAIAPAKVEKMLFFARNKLKISNDDNAAIKETASWIHTLLTTDPLPVAMLRRCVARPTFPAMRHLLTAMSRAGLAGEIARVEAALQQVAHLPVAEQPLLSGHDLIKAGFLPGPAFKKILEEIYDHQLEDRLHTRDDALAWAQARFDQIETL